MRQDQIIDLGDQLRMEGVARFRDNFNRFDCLYFIDHEVLKLFQPQSVRKIGGRSTDRVLSGSMGFALRSEVGETGARKWSDMPASISLVPIMNFPDLIGLSALSASGEVEPDYVDKLHSLMRRLPATCSEIDRRFGPDFLTLPRLDRSMLMARELRAIDD
jgi:hypothetical protein